MTTDTARRITLTIPGEPAYALSPNARCHWAVKQRETNEAAWCVKQAIWDNGFRPARFAGPVRLHWTIYLARGGKKRDATNIIASLKAHEDALVREGIIAGDSPRWIPETPTVTQIVWSTHRSDPKIIVTIEEAV